MRKTIRFSIYVIIIILFANKIYANNIEGTSTYKDYIFILVHGLNSSKDAFTGKTGFGGLKEYLEKDLHLKGHVFVYSFSNPTGTVIDQARELGDESYHNPQPLMEGKCWLKKARDDFAKDNPGKTIPDKYILLTHSMGNFAARGYIYSEYLAGQEKYYGLTPSTEKYYAKGFYKGDVDKVVFIAPPLLGSDMVMLLWKKYYEWGLGNYKQTYWGTGGYSPIDRDLSSWYYVFQLKGNSLNEIFNNSADVFVKYLSDITGGDPFGPYQAAADISGLKLISALAGSGGAGSKMFGPFAPALIDLAPYSPIVVALSEAHQTDPTKEPAYSIVYARGVPVYDAASSLGMAAVKGINDFKIQKAQADLAEAAAMRGSDYFDPSPALQGNIIGQILTWDYNRLTLFHPKFWSLSTSQSKFFSLLAARTGGFFTQDGDGLVQLPSAVGEGVACVKNAGKHEHIFKTEHFEKYLSEQFPIEISVTEAAIATAAYLISLSGTPYEIAWRSLWPLRIPLALSLIDKVFYDANGLVSDFQAHGRILEQTDLIKTAVLDTPAIFILSDLQSTEEAKASAEAQVLSFTISSPEAGYHSIKVRSVSEDRNHNDTVDMPVPTTLNNERKYITLMTVTKAPKRIAGKLNYLVPRLMKSFEYSFNFAAWKPIQNVDPETGEFILEGLPFAEGQNILAVRAENAVGVKSHQLLKIVLNTIPLLPSQFNPKPNYYINDSNPTISVEFNKSEYTGDYNSEKVTIKEMMVDGEIITPQVESTMESYHPWAKASYKVPSDKPLGEGEHRVAVKAESNVGVAQGLWTFWVDKTPPIISIEAIAPYSPRSPTTIRYMASDEVSPNLLAVRCDLYDSNNNFVTNIATADSLSKGENLFSWNPTANSSTPPTDGKYKIKIKAFDLAGNYTIAEQAITIDSNPPIIAGIAVSPNPMTSKTNELGLTARMDEKATVIIKMNNTSNNSTVAYVSQAEKAPDGNGYLASYSWRYEDMFAKGPEDGIYRVEVTARDEAGNESLPKTLEAVRIDRTPPKIYGQITNPYVLANIGANAYKTTLSYKLSDPNRPLANDIKVKIKLYNSNTGKLVNKWDWAPGATTSDNQITWNGAGTEYPKGAYRFQIIAEDDVGNIGSAYASCVKDGIAPVISFPSEDGAETAGTIAIRGTAIDPDWTNDLPFKQYRVYYAKGSQSAVVNPGPEWKTDAIEVPMLNRGSAAVPKNTSLRPLQNDATLAYLYTNLLENGEYTLLVVVDEEGGESLAAAKIIKVNNDLTASAVQPPYIKLKPLPAEVIFRLDDSVKLPIGFINSVKPANVYVEILKPGTAEAIPVFFKYFPNILGAPFIGSPEYQAGKDLGYFIWSDDTGYHLRWSADGSSHKFTGSIILAGEGSYQDIKQVGSGVKIQSPLISWDATLTGAEGGVDFKLNSGQIMIMAKIDEDPNNPSIYAENVYLGVSKYTQSYLPIMIDVAGQRLVDMTKMGGNASGTDQTNLERETQTVNWDGKLDTGGYVDSANYIIRVRAEGVDGIGVATEEALVKVSTPFDLKIKEVTPKERVFSSLSAPDRISVFYNVSKDSIVSASVYDSSDKFLSKLIENEEVLGNPNPSNSLSVTWRGNYPDPESGLVVNGGTYKIRLDVSAKDGTASKSEIIDNISVASFTKDTSKLNLEPIGEEIDFHNGNGLEKIRLATGDSPFYIEARATGKYHPPKDFSYALMAAGKQRITAYPYVPFAGLMHRGFREVNTKAKVKFRFHGWNWEQGKEEVYARAFGVELKWWNPLAWDRRYKEWEEERMVDSLVFKEGDESKTLTFEFDTNNYWHQNDWDTFQGKANPGAGIDSVDVKAEIFSKDGSFSLDITPEDKWIPLSESRITGKGIFKITNNGEQYTTHHGTSKTGGYFVDVSYGAYRVNLNLQLESPIAYSRLTNRFVPWVGFVNYKNSLTKDFSVYLTDINRGLGFPGKKFFEDPDAKPDATAFKSTSEVVAELQGLKWEEQSARLAEMGKTANLLGYKDALASSAGYDSYLSNEYYEFIPITWPEQAENKKSGFEFKNSSPVVKASTNLIYYPDKNPISPFEFSWPWNESEKAAFDAQQESKRKQIDPSATPAGNPQLYTGITAPDSTSGTWWQLYQDEISQRKAEGNNKKIGSGQVRFDKSISKSAWQSTQSLVELLPIPNYVSGVNYSVYGYTPGIRTYLTSTGKYGKVKAEDIDTQGIDWRSADDLTLLSSGSAIKSGPLTFNEKEFLGRRELKISDFYHVSEDYQSAAALKYTFLKKNPFVDDGTSPVDNPNLVISDWQINVKDKTGNGNKDLQPENINLNGRRLDDSFTLKLKLDAAEARYVEILGTATDPRGYELMYFDGKTWKTIYQSSDPAPKTGRLAWWDISRLNGKCTVLLKSGNYIATQDVSIGTLINKDGGGSAYSTYKRAQLKFPAGSFVNGSKLPQDQLVTITPVSMQEIYIRNRPIILTSGPIVEIKPSPWKFTVSTLEGVDQRPTLRFIYTFEDLADPKLNMWDASRPLPDPGTNLGLPMNIHQVTAAGDLQMVSGNKQEVEVNNGEHQYVFYAALDHFSTYALLPGKFTLSAPIVFADRYITNKDTVTVYGTAEPNSILSLYVKTENIPPDPKKGEVPLAEMAASADKGDYRFEKVKLLREGENYIFITSHLKNNPDVLTFGDVTIVKDTAPPSLEAKPNLYAFSPNDDGKYDSVDYTVKTNEKGKIYFAIGGQPINEEIVAEPNMEYKIRLGRDSVTVASGREQISERSLSSKFPDGEYHSAVYAIDEAGNISNNIINSLVVDTAPPAVLGLSADPNPFTPNDDGIKDTTRFWYKFSEPVYVKQNIFRDDGKFFKAHEGPTENFIYPTAGNRDVQSQVSSAGYWTWDGRGSRNELIGSTYTYSLNAEDWVGNSVSSEVKSVVVDRVPTLIPYAYADPDPFAPVNPNNSFTEIKYYLGRDNLRVKAAVVGQEGRAIKTLVRDEIQNKGEHIIRWYGDFDSGYTGMTASKNSYRVGDGSYEFKISAEDINEPTAKPAIVSNTVLVDNIPPNILIKNLAVDYLSKKALLAYSIPENASVEVYVYSKDGDLLTTLVNGDSQTAGEHSVSYSLAGEGENYFKIAATDRARNRQEIETSAFAANPNQFRITNQQAVPATFTPNGDGHADLTRISYNLNGGVPDYKVSINILNPAGATVKRLIADEAQNSGNYSFYWDGKTDGGQFAADGYYEYQILATDKLGASIEQRGTVLSVSTRPTIGLTTNQPVFSPNGDGSKDTVTFNYSINYPTFYISGEALVKIEVLNSTGEAVWSRVFNHTAGSYVYEYIGLTADGLQLTAGNYYVKISAEDALGTTAITKTVPLQVDYAEPTVAIQSIAPDPFSPYLNGVKDQTVISYTLARPAYVSVRVKQGEAVVKTLQSNQWTEAYVPAAGLSAKNLKALGIPTLTWNGKDASGNFVADGSYSIEISAIDSAGNSSSVSRNVMVDNTEPAVPVVDSLPANTNQGLQYITGSGEPNSLTKVYLNDNLISSGNASDSGSFSIPTNLFAGANNIKLAATDVAGNMSAFSTIQSVIYETDAPIISNVSAAPNPAKAGPIIINFNVSETLESAPIVTINNNPASPHNSLLNLTTYEYLYNVTPSDQQGPAVVSIEARDLADNVTLYQNNNLLTIDTINTNISNVDINVAGNPRGSNQTAYARSGSKVNIDFSVSESLLMNPVVKVGGKTATQENKTVFTSSRIDYSYSYTIAETDPDGTTPVTIEVTDLAGNLSVYSFNNSLIADQTTPEVSNLSASPNPASVPSVSGQVSIKFNVSEPLKEAPKVYVTQNGASPQLAVVGGQWTVVGGQCEAKYDAVTGNDGPALITIEVTDLATNSSVYSFNNSLTVDTIKPVFSGIQSEIGSNPEFTKFAKEESEVTIIFKSSELLKFNPDVKINNNLANYNSGQPTADGGQEYTYKYTVMNSDTNGNATLSIYGLDYALNEGTAETSSSSESFVIDLVNPTVAIADPSSITEWISNPASFATNEDPNNPNVHRSTTFYYKLAEDSKVTVKVHKVGDSQIAYTKSDFNDTTLIKTLVSDVWQDGGIQQSVLWNGTGNVGPGKYAFIVEGRDRANNLTLKKWGGTVWIQDNVLTLNEPDQFDFTNANIIPTPEVNPDPHYISPNGNSTEPAQKRARFYFMINLSLNPATTTQPEKIEVLWTAAPIKKVGKYSVKVYSDSGLTNLVRTITSEADVYSASLTYEDWDGKTDGGQYAADGIYYMAVDVRDFAGNPAVSNLLTRSVVIDNTPPLVSNLAAAPYYFSPGNTESTIKTTTITYEVWDNQSKAKVTIDVFKGASAVKNLLSEVWKDNGSYSQTWEGTGPTGYVGTRNAGGFGDGIYTIKVSAVDMAGNLSGIKTREVYVDTMGPNPPSLSSVVHGGFNYSPAAPSWSTHGSPQVTWTNPGDNGGSGVGSYAVSIDGGAWSNLGAQLFWHGTLADGANRTVDIRAVDALGNLGSAGRLSFKIDTVNPYFSSGPTVDTVNHTPINSWSKHADPYITFTGADLTSGPRDVHLYINGSDQGVKNSPWHQAFTDGTYNVRFRAYDNAGRFTDSSTYTFLIDITAPNQPSVSVGDTTPGVWSKHNSPVFTWNDPGDGSGSGVSYYRGFIDGSDQGNVSSGWSPILSDGPHTVKIRAYDRVGYWKDSADIYFYIDTTSPSVSDLPSKTFNPYDDVGNVRVDFTASDPGYSGGFSVSNISAKIKYLTNDVKTLTVCDDGGGSYHITWEGTNNSIDYENEGNYTLEISATDAVGNTPTVKTSTMTLEDDVNISNDKDNSNNPYLSMDGSYVVLRWIEGYEDIDVVSTQNNGAEVGASAGGGGSQTYEKGSDNFYIDHSQTIIINAGADHEDSEYHDMNIPGGNASTIVWGPVTNTGVNDNNYYNKYVDPGWYYVYSKVHIPLGYSGSGHTIAYYKDRKFNQFYRSSQDSGKKWGSTFGPQKVDSYQTGQSWDTYDKTYWHRVFVQNDGNVYYQRHPYNTEPSNTWIKISNSGRASNPIIREDANHNAQVAWVDMGNDNWDIFYQKVPFNFARVKGTAQGSSIRVEKQLVLTQSSTLESPTLIAPEKDKQNVNNIRPTFEWKHHRGDATQYKLDLAKNESFTIAPQTFIKSANTGSVDKNDPNLYYFNYSIHEFDAGLDRDTYFWRVTALSTNETATSEPWSFTIQPELNLSGVTNYPNPFNPNHSDPNQRRTKIRYRLSTDASEVKIRIYDITGSLVTELDGTTNGEGSSIWNKYNDVEWDGRNGRGDMVVNGIYPFEIIARLGDKTISGRGKVAVLK